MMFGFDPKVEKAVKSQILRITEELGNYGWSKNIATRVLEVYLVADLKNPNWLKTVSVFQRDDVTFVQYGFDPLFVGRHEKHADSEGNVGFVIHRYGKTLNSGIIQIKINTNKDFKMPNNLVSGQHCATLEERKEAPLQGCTNSDAYNCKYCRKTDQCQENPTKQEPQTPNEVELKQEQIWRIEKDLRQRGWTGVVIKTVLHNHLKVDDQDTAWLADVRMYGSNEKTVIRYGGGQLLRTPVTTVTSYIDNLKVTHHTYSNDTGGIILETVQPQPVNDSIKDDTQETQAQHDKGNKMNEQKEQSIMTRTEIHTELVQKDTSEAAARAIELLLMQFGFDLGVPGAEIYQHTYGILFTYGNYGRFYGAAKKSMHIGEQKIEWVMDHEGGVFDISGKKEIKMKSEKTRRPIEATLVWDKLNSAGLPNEAVLFIVKALYGTAGLKPPTDERQVTILNRHKVYEVVYSRDGAVVTCDAGDDFIVTLSDGTQMVGSAGTNNACYIVKKKKEPAKDELLEKHARGFMVSVSTTEGTCDVPFNYTATDLGDEGIKLNVFASMEFFFKDGVLHSTKGPVHVSPNGKKYYFVDGNSLTEEEFNNRILANQGSWEDTEA